MIRLAEEKDCLDIIIILNMVLEHHHKIKPELFKGEGSKYNSDEIKQLLKDSNRRTIVYEHDGKIVGHLFLELKEHAETNTTHPYKELYIDDLGVLEEYQGQGIGRSLYEYAKEFGKANGFDVITLNVYSGNDAEEFYQKLGLKPRKVMLEEIL